jgi:hypothetical protein
VTEKRRAATQRWVRISPVSDGGRYWIRTSDPADVNRVL